ncbi:MAG: methylenetetrahydrofolate reductase C-terminal domain-containing protein [Nitrospirota bacterium]
MIITKKKDVINVLEALKDRKKVFLLGCSECASLCGTGNEEALEDMKKELEANNIEVTGWFIPKTACQVLGTKRELKAHKEAIAASDAILTMSCGAGTQTTEDIFPEKRVYTANDTLFLGNMTRFKHFDERCSLCGDCVLNNTGGICPVTTCPKGLLNGPCGGVKNGKCEVNRELDCCWVRIYERLKKIGDLDKMKEINGPKDYSKHVRPMVVVMER